MAAPAARPKHPECCAVGVGAALYALLKDELSTEEPARSGVLTGETGYMLV